MEADESNKVFPYLSDVFIHDIFDNLIHDKEITNCFMREPVTEYYRAFENVIEENNTLFEQTEKRKEFAKKNKEFIQKQIRKNETTDYYENFFKIILLPFMHFQTKSIKLRLSLPLLYDRILHKNNRVAGWADLSFLRNGGDAYEKSF